MYCSIKNIYYNVHLTSYDEILNVLRIGSFAIRPSLKITQRNNLGHYFNVFTCFLDVCCILPCNMVIDLLICCFKNNIGPWSLWMALELCLFAFLLPFPTTLFLWSNNILCLKFAVVFRIKLSQDTVWMGAFLISPVALECVFLHFYVTKL